MPYDLFNRLCDGHRTVSVAAFISCCSAFFLTKKVLSLREESRTMLAKTMNRPAGGKPSSRLRQFGERNMDNRTTRVESTLDQVHEDVRSLRGDIRDLRKSQRADFHITWAGLIGLCMVIAKGFHWF
jgi:hypothetical protein